LCQREAADGARVWTWWADDGVHWVLVALDGDDGTLIRVLGPGTKPFYGEYGYLLDDVDTIARDVMLHFSGGDEEVMDCVRQWLVRSLRGD
jgi:hypothetical protein